MKYRLPAFTIAAFSVALPASALAATITVTDINVPLSDTASIVIPTIEVTDSPLDEAAIRAFFTAGGDSAATTVSTLDAARVLIPELTFSATVAGADTPPVKVVYRNLDLTDVKSGVAAAASIGGMDMQNVDGGAFHMGTMSAKGLDLGGIVGFYGLGARAGSTEMITVYSDMSIDGMTFSGPNVECTIGRASGDSFSMRPLKVAFADFMKAAEEVGQPNRPGTAPTPETIQTFVQYYVELLTAFQSSPITIENAECKGKNEAGLDFAFTSGPFDIGGFEPGAYPALSLDGFKTEVAGQGAWSFDNFTWKTMDLTAPIAAIEAAMSQLDAKWFETNWRKLIPEVQGMSLSGGKFDMAEAAAPGGRVAGGIAAFDVTLGDYVNGIPSTISTSASGITFPLPQTGEGAQLRALGIDTVDLGYDLRANWDDANKSIVVERLAVSGVDLGTIAISGILGNALPELFADDPEVAVVAALGMTVRELTLEIENAGIAPALIAMAAQEEKMTPQQMHGVLAGLAQALPFALLGAGPEGVGLSQALGSFLMGAPKLTVTLTATNPTGVTLAELMAAQENPALLKGKVTVNASTSGDPVPFTWTDPAAPTEPAPASKITDKTST